MRRFILLTCCISVLALATSLAVVHVAAQHGSSSYALISSAFGGIATTPRVAGDYSLIAASDPNAQQLLSGGSYSLASAHPGLLSRVPASESPDTEQPGIPRLWQIVFADAAGQQQLAAHKTLGFDAAFKCVAYEYHAGGEWRKVEATEGQYDWSSLRNCLDNAQQINMWFIPELVINVPPAWFIERYPDSLLKDSRGLTNTDEHDEGAPYLLSPWFVATGAGDEYLESLFDSFLSVVSEYPNVPAVMIGNFKLNVLPWKMGTDKADDFTYWPIWDEYALTSYASEFGEHELPPATWNDYQSMSDIQQAAFRDWLTKAIRNNLQHRYLPWIVDYPGGKVFNAPAWNSEEDKGSIFTTMTPQMALAKQTAMAAVGVDGIIINDDNMGDCGLAEFHQAAILQAHESGFLIVGERVPGTCRNNDWSRLFSMWENFDPRPDGFINIGEADGEWVSKFRELYGAASVPPTPEEQPDEEPTDETPSTLFVPAVQR